MITAQQTIEMGDIVRLKSGGPECEVIAIEGEDVTIQWTDSMTLPRVCVSLVRASG